MADLIDIAIAKKLAGGGSGGVEYDAVVMLTHDDSSGGDTTATLTPSIVSGTFADLAAKIGQGIAPNILVKYVREHPTTLWESPLTAITYYVEDDFFCFMLIGLFSVDGNDSTLFPEPLTWWMNNSIQWG